MKNLILVRHGESEWNKMNLFTGWTDVDLTPLGMSEAFMAGDLLKREGYQPTLCFTSFLKRAVKTLNQVLDAMNMDYLPVQKSWRLNEKSYGMLQGKNKVEMVEKYGAEQVQLWRRSYAVQPPAIPEDNPMNPRRDPRYDGIPDNELPHTEALKDTLDRLLPYFEGVIMPALKEHDTLLVVAHGNSLRGIVKVLKDMPDEAITGFNIPTAVPYIFQFNEALQLQNDFYLGNKEEIERKINGVKNQTSKK